MSAWQPIETAPKMRTLLLYAVTDVADDGTVCNWKMATGSFMDGYDDERSKARGFTGWEWGGERLKNWQCQPTHWMPLPAPPPTDPAVDPVADSRPPADHAR